MTRQLLITTFPDDARKKLKIMAVENGIPYLKMITEILVLYTTNSVMQNEFLRENSIIGEDV
jgi:hypothetical protein